MTSCQEAGEALLTSCQSNAQHTGIKLCICRQICHMLFDLDKFGMVGTVRHSNVKLWVSLMSSSSLDVSG